MHVWLARKEYKRSCSALMMKPDSAYKPVIHKHDHHAVQMLKTEGVACGVLVGIGIAFIYDSEFGRFTISHSVSGGAAHGKLEPQSEYTPLRTYIAQIVALQFVRANYKQDKLPVFNKYTDLHRSVLYILTLGTSCKFAREF